MQSSVLERLDDRGVGVLESGVLADKNDVDMVKKAVVSKKGSSELDTAGAAIPGDAPNRQRLPVFHQARSLQEPSLVHVNVVKLEAGL